MFLVILKYYSQIIPLNVSSLLLPLVPPNFSIISIIGNFLWLRKSFTELKHIICSLHAKFGLIITLNISPRPSNLRCRSQPCPPSLDSKWCILLTGLRLLLSAKSPVATNITLTLPFMALQGAYFVEISLQNFFILQE